MSFNADLLGYFFTKFMMLIFGSLLFFPATSKIISYSITRNTSSVVYGTVARPGCGRYLGCRPLVVYRDHNGTTHEMKSTINYHWFFAPKEGETVKILYHRNAPDIFIIDSILHYVAIPLIFAFLGILIFISTFSGKIKRMYIIGDEQG